MLDAGGAVSEAGCASSEAESASSEADSVDSVEAEVTCRFRFGAGRGGEVMLGSAVVVGFAALLISAAFRLSLVRGGVIVCPGRPVPP